MPPIKRSYNGRGGRRSGSRYGRSRSGSSSSSSSSRVNLSGLYNRSPRSSPRGGAPVVRRYGRFTQAAQDALSVIGSTALNTLAPGAGTALSMAYNRGSRTNVNRTRNARMSAGTSVYSGRLRKAKKNKQDIYSGKGMKHVVETSGVVSDPDCVYVGHATYIPYLVLEMVMQVLLRRLFEKAGLSVTGLSDPLYPQQNVMGGSFVIQLDRLEANGSMNSFSHVVTQISTLGTICGDFVNGIPPQFIQLRDVLLDYGVGNGPVSDVNVAEPYQLRLFEEIYNTSGSRYHRASINLRDCVIKSFFSSNIKIQNRTVSATGSEDSEAVSANPLYCSKYLFTGVPRQRDKTRMFKYPIAETGVLTYGAAAGGVGGIPYMKEPPSPKLFWNCSKNAKDVIQPGSIKSDRIKLGKSMRLLRYLRWIGLQVDNQAVIKTDALKGPFMMYALEDVINVNLTQVITIAYEVNRVMGMYCYEKKVKFATGGVYQQTQDAPFVPPD